MTLTFFSVLTACSSPTDCSRADVFCAALVTDTLGLDDNGLNSASWAGLRRAEEDGIINQLDFIASTDSRDYPKNLAYFVQRKYDLIVASGVSLSKATFAAAESNPQIVFVGVNQTFDETLPNLVSVTFPEDQMGFAAGTLAAELTRTNYVAAFCETSGIAAMKRYCEGFRAGVKYVNPQVKVLVVYRDDGDRENLFADESWGYQSAQKAILRGADVIFAAGGVTAQGALKAASDLKIPALGAERDQAAALGESASSVVASFYGQSQLATEEAARLIRAGQTVPAHLQGEFGYTPLKPTYPTGMSERLNAVLEALKRGEIGLDEKELR